MIIQPDRKIQINFSDSVRDKYVLVTPRELGFTDPTDFSLIFRKLKEREGIALLKARRYPSIYNPAMIFSLSLPLEKDAKN